MTTNTDQAKYNAAVIDCITYAQERQEFIENSNYCSVHYSTYGYAHFWFFSRDGGITLHIGDEIMWGAKTVEIDSQKIRAMIDKHMGEPKYQSYTD